MFIDDENYEPTTSFEIDTLLAELPFELMKENIKDQIENPLSTNINYIDIIVEKTEILKSQFENDMDTINKINNNLRDFFSFIINKLNDKFILGLIVDEEDDETVVKTGEVLYNFLILLYKKNVSKFLLKYILKNKKSLIDYFDKKNKKKDVTSISLKKQLKNKDDILIIANLPQVIKYILNLYIEPLDFIKYCCDEELYEGKIIKDMILSGKLLTNFIPTYLSLLDDYESILDEISIDIKIRLIKKLS
jgi:hypothetical protein